MWEVWTFVHKCYHRFNVKLTGLTNSESSTSPNVNICSTQWEYAGETSSVYGTQSLNHPGQSQSMPMSSASTPFVSQHCYASHVVQPQGFNPQVYVVPLVPPMAPYNPSSFTYPFVYQLSPTPYLHPSSFSSIPASPYTPSVVSSFHGNSHNVDNQSVLSNPQARTVRMHLVLTMIQVGSLIQVQQIT